MFYWFKADITHSILWLNLPTSVNKKQLQTNHNVNLSNAIAPTFKTPYNRKETLYFFYFTNFNMIVWGQHYRICQCWPHKMILKFVFFPSLVVSKRSKLLPPESQIILQVAYIHSVQSYLQPSTSVCVD